MKRAALCFGSWLALAACSSQAPSSGESEGVGQSEEALNVCVLGCCIGTAQAWTSDPFEAQLKAWGCTQPKAYTPNQSTGAWWMWSQCADPNQRVESFLASHPAYVATPYQAVVTTKLNPLCALPPPSGSVDVLWDPTCTTCKALLGL